MCVCMQLLLQRLKHPVCTLMGGGAGLCARVCVCVHVGVIGRDAERTAVKGVA